ncbi:triosephosphate isomerase [archaeon BMS3Abin16]|nr:triosephosphate isomerase [archaeon BMS3Abin16]HDY74365.1 triose-phosphate isomerase [Euryarchaeota archaeon]
MSLKTPVIVLNVKSYEESMGERGLALALACEEVTAETGVVTAICPQMVDLAWIARQVKVPVFSQNTDIYEPGSCTGWTVAEAVKEAGAIGTLLNHSEHRLRLDVIEHVISKNKGLGLVSIVCTNNTPVTRAAAALGPEMVAIEPPELIGSGISVSKAQPEIVEDAVSAVKKINPGVKVLCGAGISTGEDVKAALALGAEGVLLASGVVKAANPKAALLDLAGGI